MVLKGGMEMLQTLHVNSSKRTEFIDITRLVQEVVQKARIKEGLCILFVPHTTAAITINENADPSVPRDIQAELNKVIPFEDQYQHTEGNSAAHIKSSLIGISETLLIESGKLVLGTWQGIFFCEFDGPRSREIHVKIIDSGRNASLTS